jgi:DNA-binding LacI/PurR family transcriptional regulator
MSATILYLNTAPGDRIQEMTLAGIRRYAAARRWEAESVPWQASRPEDIPRHLAAHRPVAGCVIECADGSSHLPPQLFGRVPAVYLHAAPSLYGGRIARVSADNEAVARFAFRELSAGRPAAYAVVEAVWKLDWSDIRSRTFQALAARAGMPCRVFAFREESDGERDARLAGWVADLPRNCAVFAVNDRTAENVATVARAIHRSIPHELTLLGVDNDVALCETSAPPISSIQLDHERAGFLAARLIGDAFATKNTKGQKDFVNSVPFAARSATIGPLLAVRRRSTGGSGRREKFVLEAVEMIRREASDGLTAMELAKRFRCSRRLFNMRFREATGHSVLDEIQHVRLEKVFALLSGTDTAIGAIADFCGFGSDVELRHVFRSRTGKSLRQWRKENGRG